MDAPVPPSQRLAELDARRTQLRPRVDAAVLSAFERAAEAVGEALDGLGLVDLGPLLGSPMSPNVLRRVRTSSGDLGVLKLVGTGDLGESATLAAWTEAGVAAVPLLDHGLGRWVPEVVHLLMRDTPGEPMPHTAMAGWTGPVVAALARAHLPAPVGVRPLVELLAPRLTVAAEVWAGAGLGEPPPVLDALVRVADGTLLHGDAVGMNLLLDSDRVWLLDPAGVHGPAEFDAGRWVGRSLATAGPSALVGLLDVSVAADPSLRRDVLDLCVAAELVLEVRHRVTSPDAFVSIGAAADTFDADTRQLVVASRDLAAAWG